MDIDKEKAITIHLPHTPVKFIEMENGLHARLPKYLNNNKTTDISYDHERKVQFRTVEENLNPPGLNEK